MSSGLYSGSSGLALGVGLYASTTGLWSGGLGLDSALGGFTPLSLFSAGEQGVWYDPSDISTVWQDSAGTVPGAVGQPVGKLIDKSGRGNHATQAVAASRPILRQSGALYYLEFDGVDDCLVTGTVASGSSDKVSVFAGVRTATAGVQGIIAESSSTTNGFTLASGSAGAADTFRFVSRGSVSSPVDSPAASTPAPYTAVLSGIGAISTDQALIRVNGAQVGSSAADQGTGTFADAPFYIGMRGGTTVPFNGRLYGLVVRYAPEMTSTQISNTETYVNTRTGAY